MCLTKEKEPAPRQTILVIKLFFFEIVYDGCGCLPPRAHGRITVAPPVTISPPANTWDRCGHAGFLYLDVAPFIHISSGVVRAIGLEPLPMATMAACTGISNSDPATGEGRLRRWNQARQFHFNQFQAG